MPHILAALAALMGAAGVATAALAAHAAADPRLASAAQMLMIHAAAITALLALGRNSAAPKAYLLSAVLMLCGVALFSADIAMRVFLAGRLFPMAAPIGGSLTIGAWLAAAVAALLAMRRRAG